MNTPGNVALPHLRLDHDIYITAQQQPERYDRFTDGLTPSSGRSGWATASLIKADTLDDLPSSWTSVTLLLKATVEKHNRWLRLVRTDLTCSRSGFGAREDGCATTPRRT